MHGHTLEGRGYWQGAATIARFNWPFYVAALAVLIGATAGAFTLTGGFMRLVMLAAALAAAYFLIGSLGVSHLVYDRSDLYRLGWVDRALGGMKPVGVIFCHAGLDETSRALRDRLRPAKWTVLDHFDAASMTEASIQRARRMFPPTAETVPAPFAHWPAPDADADAVFALFAVHEFRQDAERRAWFAEARRCLRSGGRVIVVEHLRDLANFIAFGPGFMHFHSRAAWERSWRGAGLKTIDEFCVTPWVRVFVLGVS